MEERNSWTLYHFADVQTGVVVLFPHLRPPPVLLFGGGGGGGGGELVSFHDIISTLIFPRRLQKKSIPREKKADIKIHFLSFLSIFSHPPYSPHAR